jgi:hypothetical protein
VRVDPEAMAYLEATAALGLPSTAEQGVATARRATAERAPSLAGVLEPLHRKSWDDCARLLQAAFGSQ